MRSHPAYGFLLRHLCASRTGNGTRMPVIERLETVAKQHCGCTELALGVIFLSAGMQLGDMLFFHQGLKMTGPLSVRSTGSGKNWCDRINGENSGGCSACGLNTAGSMLPLKRPTFLPTGSATELHSSGPLLLNWTCRSMTKSWCNANRGNGFSTRTGQAYSCTSNQLKNRLSIWDIPTYTSPRPIPTSSFWAINSTWFVNQPPLRQGLLSWLWIDRQKQSQVQWVTHEWFLPAPRIRNRN